MKIFISADIEGVTGIANWDETKLDNPQSQYFRGQMTMEVKAACEAAIEAGADEVIVKDAHSSGRNIDPSKLPEKAKILRGWARNPYVMMAGLDDSFDGVLFVGYHSAAGTDGNPLAHTMDTENEYVMINGIYASELLINSYTAALLGVPVLFVSGDKLLCEEAKRINKYIETVAVSEGVGGASISIHPDLAVKSIKQKVHEALNGDLSKRTVKMPEKFKVEIHFRNHSAAYGGSFYPGARQTGTKTVEYEAADYFEVLKFLFFVL
ncbi:MAG TPA: M55 family metallopeptidase [Clostridia bacterium]|nr:M55 family metallopeptidase [Clostridia bacterium]